jgi:GcrA cell cycle regulator
MPQIAAADEPTVSRCNAWTPEREARAVRLFLQEGFTASQVADALGDGLTRGAVIGKIRRLGFLKRERRAAEATPAAPRLLRFHCERTPRIERRLPPQRPPQPLPPLREVPAAGVPVPLSRLADHQCRWPIDDPGPARMHLALFCAGPAVHGSYCAAHAALANGRLAATVPA